LEANVFGLNIYTFEVKEVLMCYKRTVQEKPKGVYHMILGN
jgi:hypothetical protein